MGQYQLWLQYREIDQQLHTELESLTRDLAQLQEQANRLELADSSSSNLIIQALTQYLQPEIQVVGASGIASSNGVQPDQPAPQLQQTALKPFEKNGATTAHSETVSPALFAWSNLPNFDTGKIRGPDPLSTTPSQAHLHSEFDLLPTDMNTFFHTHSQTAPQLKLPWWLRNTTPTPQQPDTNPQEQRSAGQIDQQSLRTNQLVQRWLERWRKRSADVPGSQEVKR